MLTRPGAGDGSGPAPLRRLRPPREVRAASAVLAIACLTAVACGDGTVRTETASQRDTTTSAPPPVPASSSSSTSSSTVAVARTTTTIPKPTTTATVRTSTTTVVQPTTTATTTPERTTVTTSKPRTRPPGPPGPKYPNGGPNALSETVDGWYALLKDEVATGACQPLLLAVQKSPDGTDDPGVAAAAKAYATLYKGAAEGCLGQLTAAKVDLDQASRLLAALDPTAISTDLSCQPQMLLVWAYETYLNQKVALVCPPKS